jgi:hypothetical protein
MAIPSDGRRAIVTWVDRAIVRDLGSSPPHLSHPHGRKAYHGRMQSRTSDETRHYDGD